VAIGRFLCHEGEMKLTLVFALSLFTFSVWGTAARAGTPPGFDAVKWKALQDQVAKVGVRSDTPHGTYVTVMEIIPNAPTEAHHADYFSVVGGVNSNGTFIAGHAEDVSENWQINSAGDWDVDQWLFVVNLMGDVTLSLHYHLMENKAGDVLLHDPLPATEAECLDAWNTRLGVWYKILLN
jgi:hypothetical protein